MKSDFKYKRAQLKLQLHHADQVSDSQSHLLAYLYQAPAMKTFLAFCVSMVLAMVSNNLVVPAAAQLTNSSKLVFAHYMIYYPDSIDTYKQEIQLAKSKGIDAFALNTNIYRPNLFDNMYNAANQLNIGFKLFFSADIHCCDPGTSPPNDRLSPANIISMLVNYRNNPSQLYYKGKSFFTSWLGNADSYWSYYGYANSKAAWDDIFAQAGGKSLYYYLPFYPTDGSYYGVLGTVYNPFGSTVDGYYNWERSAWNYENNNWNTPTTSPGDATSLQVSQDYGKTYMAMVSPWFSKNSNDAQCCQANSPSCDPNGNFDSWAGCPCQVKGNYQGSGLWLQKWAQIIANPSPLVEIATWNDWAEGSYIAPPLSGGATSGNFAIGDFTHHAYLELAKHYITWFKTGSEPVETKDQIYLFYYTQGSGVTVPGPPCGILHAGVLTDTVYAVLVMKPGPTATLTLQSGSASNTVTTTQTQGVFVHGIGFQTGTQSASITRGSVTYTLTGLKQISNSGLSSYNFNVYSIFCANVQNGYCGLPVNQNS